VSAVHHPSDEAMLGFAAGSMSPVLGLVVASHLALCAACRQRQSVWEALAGAHLETLPPGDMKADALARTLAQLDAPIADASASDTPTSDAPEFLVVDPATGLVLPAILNRPPSGKRRWLAPGIWLRPLAADRKSDTHAYLLGAAAGKKLPHHRHGGVEMTCVLSGDFFDGPVRYGPGDFREMDEADDHRPVVGSDRACICVIGSQGLPLGILGWFMRPFA
jgi:putative transcriptional regulator